MKRASEPIAVVGSRATDHGLLVKFSDGQFYLFCTSFLIENRDKGADGIQHPSAWLYENWKKAPAI
jgi:hypothetical protein